MENSITDLGDGKAFALHNILELDGRVSAYPKSTRGFSSMNCYLLREDNAAVLTNEQGETKGSGIKGPVSREAAERWPRIAAAATTIV